MLAIVATACEVCLSRADDSNMLLCDGCDAGYHTYCTTPQIEEVPEGDWFCVK
jgi:histone demethylase JARID1